MKTCSTCNKTKPSSAFTVDQSKPDGLHYRCRTCYAEYQAEYRNADRNRYRQYAKNHKIKCKIGWLVVVEEIFGDLSCSECGYLEVPEVLEFHHVGVKEYEIARLRQNYPTPTAVEEVKKCELLCPTCHRIKHLIP